MRYSDITEGATQTVRSNIFAMAKTAYSALGHDAQSALESWETMGWTGGKLEQHIRANDAIAQEIEAAFAPIRAQLPEQVTLYRGIVKDSSYEGWNKAFLQSWTSDQRTAELFAGLRRGPKWNSLLRPDITDQEIDTMVSQYERTGFLRFGGRYYVRNKDVPQYYNIYDRSKQFVTDGDDIEEDLRDEQKYRREANTSLQDKSHVFEEEVNRDRIVWITNALNCKEFLVRV